MVRGVCLGCQHGEKGQLVRSDGLGSGNEVPDELFTITCLLVLAVPGRSKSREKNLERGTFAEGARGGVVCRERQGTWRKRW